MSFRLHELVDAAPILKTAEDCVLKCVGARDAVMALPSPSNVPRNPASIPDIPVWLLLSTSEKMPKAIAKLMEQSKSKAMFDGENFDLAGLCMNGLGYPVRLFIHRGLLGTGNDAAEMFEMLFWHEYLHGAEGITEIACGVQRDLPWSFRFQARLLMLDERGGGALDLSQYEDSPAEAAHVDYLRSGLDLQGHASELFARVGALMLRHVRTTGEMPQSREDVYDFFARNGLARDLSMPSSNVDGNVWDLWMTLASHGPAARELAWKGMPRLVHAAARLYGCAV